MTPAELKQAGQMESLWATTPDIWDDFVQVITDAPDEQSSNDTRARLNDMGVPESARGALYNRAIKAGLIVKKMTVDGYPARIPSTSPKTHLAYVQLYVKVSGLNKFTRRAS